MSVQIPSSSVSWPKQTAQQPLKLTPASQVLDLLCIGFGPASIAIAIAQSELSSPKNIQFLERQSEFAWHSGMQLPGARMQISFLKDLATPRNPKSKYTFINYLHSKGRLDSFINCGTFTPSRAEFQDYLGWCASHFEENVAYGQEVLDVSPEKTSIAPGEKITQWSVTCRDIKTGGLATRIARNVVIAIGGVGKLPSEFPPTSPKVIHSSQFSYKVASALPDRNAKYNIAVVGNGQSAAEIFNECLSRYPKAKVNLVIKQQALRPSDDSPFVNEIFDPDRVDSMWGMECETRKRLMASDKATNYGVVRLDLLEELYDKLYQQRLRCEDRSTWRMNMLNNRRVVQVSEKSPGKLALLFQNELGEVKMTEEMVVDAVFVCTGYIRNAHVSMLPKCKDLLRANETTEKAFPVRRDYKIDFDDSKVASNSGVWLQGCNESTHGLSDTLLSILAVRSGEMIESMFGADSGLTSDESVVRAKL